MKKGKGLHGKVAARVPIRTDPWRREKEREEAGFKEQCRRIGSRKTLLTR